MISTWRNAETSGWANSDNTTNFQNLGGSYQNDLHGWGPFYFSDADLQVDNTHYITIGGYDTSDIPQSAVIIGVEISFESSSMDMVYQSALDCPIHSFQLSTNCPDNGSSATAIFGPSREQQLAYKYLEGWTATATGLNWVPEQFHADYMNESAKAGYGYPGITLNQVQNPGHSPIFYFGGPGDNWFKTTGSEVLGSDLAGFAIRWKSVLGPHSGNFFGAFQRSIRVRFHYTETSLFYNKIQVSLDNYHINTFQISNGVSVSTFPNQQVWNQLITSSATPDVTSNPEYLLIGGEAVPNNGNTSIIAHQAAIEIDLSGLFNNTNLDITNNIDGITLRLNINVEWPDGTGYVTDTKQLAYYVYEGNWPTGEEPGWNNVTHDPATYIQQELGYDNIPNKNGPYSLYETSSNIYNVDGDTYDININGELLETIINNITTSLSSNLPCIIKLLLKDRRSYTFTSPRSLDSNVGSFTSAILINKSELIIHTSQHVPDSPKISRVTNIPTRDNDIDQVGDSILNTFGTKDLILDYPGHINNCLINDSPRPIEYGNLFLGDPLNVDGPLDGSISFEDFAFNTNYDYHTGIMHVAGTDWANGVGCADHGDQETSYAHPTSWKSDGYPYRRGWTFGTQRTSSSNTGPHGNNYIGGNANNGYAGEGWHGNKFAYTEATGRHHSVFRLHTSNINLRNAVRGSLFLEFHSHILSTGSGLSGRLQVNVATVDGTPIEGNQSGNTQLHWNQVPLQVYWDRTSGQIGTYKEQLGIGSESLVGQNLNYQVIGNPPENHADLYDYEPSDMEFTGRMQTSWNVNSDDDTDDSNWARIRVDLNHLVPGNLDEDKFIRIEFKGHTKPRSSNVNYSNPSGYCVDYGGPMDWDYSPNYSPEAVFPPFGNSSNNTNVKNLCENAGFSWVTVTSNRAGLGDGNYWRSDIAIDGVKVVGDRYTPEVQSAYIWNSYNSTNWDNTCTELCATWEGCASVEGSCAPLADTETLSGSQSTLAGQRTSGRVWKNSSIYNFSSSCGYANSIDELTELYCCCEYSGGDGGGNEDG